MKPSPLRLEGYYIRELSIKLNPQLQKTVSFSAWEGYHYQAGKAFKPDYVHFNVDGELGQKVDEPSRLRYILKIESANSAKKQVPYAFSLSLVGFFNINLKNADDNIKMLLHASAPELLYSAAREILASITGRGPYPAIILPSVTFSDHAEQVLISEAKQVTGEAKRVISAAKGKKTEAKKAAKKVVSKKRSG